MTETLDYISIFAQSKGVNVKPCTVFVEGTSDADLFALAAMLEKLETGIDLLGNKLAIIPAGIGNEGGARGVCREIVLFSNMAKHCLLPNGRPKYRFIGLLDNDNAGRQAISDVRKTDTSILEYRDVFRLWPTMPISHNLDINALKSKFESENSKYKGLDWELEDLIPESFAKVLLSQNPNYLYRSNTVHDKVHCEWTKDAKAKLVYLVKTNALHRDLEGFINVLHALRVYLNIK